MTKRLLRKAEVKDWKSILPSIVESMFIRTTKPTMYEDGYLGAMIDLRDLQSKFNVSNDEVKDLITFLKENNNSFVKELFISKMKQFSLIPDSVEVRDLSSLITQINVDSNNWELYVEIYLARG